MVEIPEIDRSCCSRRPWALVPLAFSARSFLGSPYVNSLSLIRFPAKKAPAVAGAVQFVAEK